MTPWANVLTYRSALHSQLLDKWFKRILCSAV